MLQQREGDAHCQGEQAVQHFWQDKIDEALRLGVVRRILKGGNKLEVAPQAIRDGGVQRRGGGFGEGAGEGFETPRGRKFFHDYKVVMRWIDLSVNVRKQSSGQRDAYCVPGITEGISHVYVGNLGQSVFYK